MKKGEILEGIVTRVDYPGKGVVETPEGICIVKNVLPGQRVSLRVSKKRRGKAEGILQEVVEKKLGVIDLAASVLAMENKMPMMLFGLSGEDSIVNALSDKFTGTIVTVE